MKIKIVEGGWEGFSGNLGMVDFENGVSVRDVTQAEANVISASIRVVNVDDDSSVGALGLDADAQNRPCVTRNLQTLEEILAQGENPNAEQPVQAAPSKQYTKEELEAIADKEGIAGLRKIGNDLDVRGTSIASLIEGILGKFAPAEANAVMLPEGQPDVVTTEQAS